VNSRIALIVFLTLGCIAARAQFASPEQAVQKNIKKKKWGKAQQQLQKSLLKDGTNTAANYLFSVWFFSPENPAHEIDSAYRYANEALKDFKDAGGREKSRLQRIPIDSGTLITLRQAIEYAAFERAKSADTEGAYMFFLSNFPAAEQREDAVMLRDEAAYREALIVNTYEAFLKFLEKYPQAVRAGEARARYERLLYEAKTQDRNLRSYELFLMEYPATPYRREVEKHLLDIMSASGDPGTFVSFIQKYPRSAYRKKAENIVFHLVREAGHKTFPIVWADSLMMVEKRDQNFLIPVLKNGQFGFMDASATLVVPHSATTILDDYKCGNVNEDILILDGKLTGRSGQVLLNDSVTDVEDLGIGFLKVLIGEQAKVIHKSGSVIVNAVEDARVIDDKFLSIKRNGKWDLSTLTGLILTTEGFDDITAVNSVIVFKKNNKLLLSTPMLIADVANNFPLKLSSPYDQVRPVSADLLAVKVNGLQSVIDRQLEALIPFTEADIEATSFGLVQKEKDAVTLYDRAARFLGRFKKFISSNSTFAVRTDSAMSFFNPRDRRAEGEMYDSIAFIGPYPLTFRHDSMTIRFDGAKRRFSSKISISYLPKKDSSGFVMVRENNKRSIYDSRGKVLFTAEFENIEYSGEGYFIVHRKEKKGLVSRTGKTILPIEYDAIGNVTRGIVTLLKSMKFGAYNISLKKLIKPQYDKNIIVYNQKMLAVFQKGQYTFIDWSNKPVIKTPYDEIQHWNDSIALVRSGFNWKLHDLFAGRDLLTMIKKLHYIRNTDHEKLAIVLQENNYGVVDNRNGIVISPTFSYIANVGSAEEPVYFTEKHVEEASIFVVIYYDQHGKLLKREVYEEEDYEKIFCPSK
jgi:hypothetical protein